MWGEGIDLHNAALCGEKELICKMRQVLHDQKWTWIGSGIVSSENVAFASPGNSIPYLYGVSEDLKCFSTILQLFGVRSEFGPSDFVAVLAQIAEETGARRWNQDLRL